MFIVSKPTNEDDNKTITGIVPKIIFNWNGVILLKLINIHNLVVAQTQQRTRKATKKLVLDVIVLKVFLKLRSPRISTLKSLNKNINENKILLAINIEVAARRTGLRLFEMRYFSKTGALERHTNAIIAKIKPIYIKHR